jgi:hypothetical protein
MEYLDRDREVFRASSERLRQAERAVLREGLQAATTYRIEFDADRLRALLGDELYGRLIQGYEPGAGERWRYDVHDAALDDERRALLLEVLAPEEPGPYAAAPDYIRSIRLLDGSDRTVLRGGDHMTFLLLDLPAESRRALTASLAAMGLGGDVIEPVSVDVTALEP